MATRPLALPDFAAVALDLAPQPVMLVRISSHQTGEPHFSRGGGSRFDSPANPSAYGTCYMGLTLDVAFAETVLHDAEPLNGDFIIPSVQLEAAWVYRFTGPDLRLADLTGPSLKRLGGHAELSGTGNYTVSRPWGAAVHSHRDLVDGFVYMSRHHTAGAAVVLFDRCRRKLSEQSCERLVDEREFHQLMQRFHVLPV